MISRIVPYLRQYVRVRTALVDARAIGVTAAELLGNVRVGVIEIGWNGEIVEANDLAMAVLRENEGLSDRDGVLRAAARRTTRSSRTCWPRRCRALENRGRAAR